eukprot:Gb_34441 [translate_table: standard]
MPCVAPQAANGLKGGEFGICDVELPLHMLNKLGLAPGTAWLPIEFPVFKQLPLVPKGCYGLDPSGCPPKELVFSCVAIANVFVYNGFLCMLNGVCERFNILSSSKSSETISPLSHGISSSVRHCNGCSSWLSNISLRSPSTINFEKSFLLPV